MIDEGWIYVLPFDHGVASVGLVLEDLGVEIGDPEAGAPLDAMEGKVNPCRVWGNIPLLVHLQQMNTSEPPLKDLFESVRAAEQEPGVLAVSVLAGFPLADTREAGLSCIVMTDGDEALGQRIRDRILAEMPGLPLAQALEAARRG